MIVVFAVVLFAVLLKIIGHAVQGGNEGGIDVVFIFYWAVLGVTATQFTPERV